jgi:hypothetical protein
VSRRRLSRWRIGLFAISLACGGGQAVDAGDLEAGFKQPPDSAKPRVWWHWMNGNISKEGVALDLQWMQRVGIGGVQLFEAGLPTPTVTPQRVIFMSPEWQEALRFSADAAQRLGMDMTLATSAGWSATGGPWVQPRDAMKKLVWSEIRLRGGVRFRGTLPKPPDVAGPFQDVPLDAVQFGPPAPPETALYVDSIVLAYPSRADAMLKPARAATLAGVIDPTALLDGKFGPTTPLASAEERTAWLQYEFATPVVVRSVRVGLPGLRGFGAPPAAQARLEASTDGVHFQTVAHLSPTTSAVRSASFVPHEARYYRLVLSRDEGPSFIDAASLAPGVALPAFMGATVAAALAVSEFQLFRAARVHSVEEKAGFATAQDYYALASPDSPRGDAVPPSAVVDLSTRMRPDGRLDWTPPAGRDYTVLRMGYSLTGRRNGPAPPEATGLEVDKLDGNRVRAYLDAYLDKYDAALGGTISRAPAIQSLLSDSIEAGPQNWTDDILKQFARLRGYDPRPWLPALTGIVVGDASKADRFLWDFRRTISQLIGVSHYGEIASGAASRGLQYYAEALEDHRPQLGDDMEMRSHADIPMGAMWMFPRGGNPKSTYIADLQGAASVAHVYGKAFVAAESMTAFGWPWGFSPRDLKSTADLEMALGVTRFAIHESAHQPLVDKAPGLALAIVLGQYFNRNETWAEQAGSWVSYLSRSSFLLQQGRYGADIAYFYGEEAPLTSLYGDHPVDDVPDGYGFDFIGADALLHRLSVDHGELVTPNGMRYRVLYLGGSSRRMTLPVLLKLRELVNAGATIVGSKPESTPSLADDTSIFRRVADALWGAAGMRHVGAGRVLSGSSLAQAMRSLDVEPDWHFGSEDAGARLAVLHRRLAEGELYFVSNRRAAPASGTLSLRVSHMQAEFFRADTGAIEQASYRSEGGRAAVRLDLAPDDALFVVLRKLAAAESRLVPAVQVEMLQTIPEDWRIRFQPHRGAPAEVAITHLDSWSHSDDPGIRYFSGTGAYARKLELPQSVADKPLILELGEVDDVAEILVNGRSAGTLWKYPYRLDISGLVRPGSNDLEIRVTNLWVNRLIGDAQSGVATVAFTTDRAYQADAPLRPSGLLGPVRLLTQR